ncbi:MAG: cysteine desulfurase, partial [Marivivens sp.]|nr:cysteine desulfurase [Marivivens sp.]NDH03935.1 cysteine desulfurase [Marivivens sp.]
RYDTWEESDARPLTPTEQKFANAEGFEDVASVIPGRCSMCHAREPFYDGIRNAPKGILLETDHDIARAATQIFLQAGVTHAMPPANVSYMEDDERRMIVEWYRNATNS